MKELNEEKLTSYQWLKIGQSVVLMVLGAVFFLTTWISKTVLSSALSYAIGAVLIVYGTLEVLSGYLLHRKALNSPVLIGLIAMSLAVVLFVEPTLLHQILSVFLIALAYGFAVMMIVASVDSFLQGKKRKKEAQDEAKKEETDYDYIKKKKKERMDSIKYGVLHLLCAVVLIGFGSTYLFFYVNERDQVERYLVMAIGIVIFLLGIVSLVSTIKKIKNTKEILLEEQLSKPVETYNTSDVVKNTDVKVIDISELKKRRARRIPRSSTEHEEKKEEIVLKTKDEPEKGEEKVEGGELLPPSQNDELDGD